jgi:hypothetical protein
MMLGWTIQTKYETETERNEQIILKLTVIFHDVTVMYFKVKGMASPVHCTNDHDEQSIVE